MICVHLVDRVNLDDIAKGSTQRYSAISYVHTQMSSKVIHERKSKKSTGSPESLHHDVASTKPSNWDELRGRGNLGNQ
jgi:hypothetical protein